MSCSGRVRGDVRARSTYRRVSAYDVIRSRRPWAATRDRPARVCTGSCADHHGASPTTPTTDGSSATWTATRAPIEWPSSTTGTSPCSARTRRGPSGRRRRGRCRRSSRARGSAAATRPCPTRGPGRRSSAASTPTGARRRCGRRSAAPSAACRRGASGSPPRSARGVVHRQQRLGHGCPSVAAEPCGAERVGATISRRGRPRGRRWPAPRA